MGQKYLDENNVNENAVFKQCHPINDNIYSKPSVAA